jgi:hypothetical protein
MRDCGSRPCGFHSSRQGIGRARSRSHYSYVAMGRCPSRPQGIPTRPAASPRIPKRGPSCGASAVCVRSLLAVATPGLADGQGFMRGVCAEPRNQRRETMSKRTTQEVSKNILFVPLRKQSRQTAVANHTRRSCPTVPRNAICILRAARPTDATTRGHVDQRKCPSAASPP